MTSVGHRHAAAAELALDRGGSCKGALYRLPPASQTLEPFAPDVRYVSPQGLAVVADGRVVGIVSRYDFRAKEHARMDEATGFLEVLR